MFARLIFFLLDQPLLTRILGLLIAVGGGWLVYNQGLELQQMRAQPIRVEISILPEAVQYNHAYYITLEGGQWDCSSVSVQRPSMQNLVLPETRAVYTSTRPFAVWVHVLGERSCADLEKATLSGTVRLIEEPEIFDVREFNPAVERLPRDYPVYDLCTFCRPAFPALAMLLGAVLVGIGLLFLPLCHSLAPDYQAQTARIYGLGPKWERRRR